MSYTGQTLRIPFSAGGFTANPNIDEIDPTMFVDGTLNLNLHEHGIRDRGGTTHVDGSAMSGAPRVMGVYDFTLASGSQFVMRATADGKIYKNQSTALKTGLTTTKYTSFETFKNVLYIANSADRPQTWDGSAGSTSDLTLIPSDWTGSNWPGQILKHGRGVSERLWAVACTGNMNTVYASNTASADFSDANVVKITINTNDGYGIVGAVEFGNRLLCFGKRKTYLIEDDSATVANWGYSAAQWEGGAAHWRLVVKTPNDVVCMTEDGDIYSVTAVQSYGDYKAASLVRPAFIDRWIRNNVNLSCIADFHAVYDPTLRAIKFFMVRQGQTTVDMALVYFIDRGPERGWMVHDNQNYVSGYSASCSAVVRKSVGSWKVYTGDYAGFVWELETANKNDNSNAYISKARLATAALGDTRVMKNMKRLWLTTEAQGAWNASVNWWVDGSAQATKTISLASTGAVLGSFVLDTDVLGGGTLIDASTDLGCVGKRLQVEVYNSNANEPFYHSAINIDFKPLSARPS